jgi:hypothetical protein
MIHFLFRTTSQESERLLSSGAMPTLAVIGLPGGGEAAGSWLLLEVIPESVRRPFSESA